MGKIQLLLDFGGVSLLDSLGINLLLAGFLFLLAVQLMSWQEDPKSNFNLSSHQNWPIFFLVTACHYAEKLICYIFSKYISYQKVVWF